MRGGSVGVAQRMLGNFDDITPRPGDGVVERAALA
jgi:hypothetical protein